MTAASEEEEKPNMTNDVTSKVNNDDRNKMAEKSDNEVQPTSIKDDHDGVPIDGGYAWMIVLSVFVIQTVNFGFNRLLSVLLKDITEEFNSRLTIVSLTFTLLTLTGGVSTLVVSNVLMVRFTSRKLCICASLMTALCDILLSVSPSIGIFLAIFVLKGMAFGVLLVCPNAMVGYYFKTKRGRATSLCNSGFCVSYIVFPPLAEMLNSTFGLRGCLLIMAAIELNMVACSMLLIPPSVFKKSNRAQKQSEIVKNGTAVMTEPAESNDDKKVSEKYDAVVPPNFNSCPELEKDVEEKAKLISHSWNALEKGDSTHVVALSCSPKSPTSLTPSMSPLQMSLLEQSSARHLIGSAAAKDRKTSLYASQQSLAISSVPYFPPEVLDTEDSNDEITRSSEDKKKNWKYYVNKVFDTSVFESYCYRMYVVFSPLASFSVYLLVYMPFIAQMAGLSQSDGAFLMMISGFMDLLARVALSFLADKKWFSKAKVSAASVAMLCLICHGSVVINSYLMFLVFATLVGVFGGVRQTLSSIILLEYIGVEKFAKGFGLLATICTLTMSLNHPIVGALLDATKSFVIPLHYVGSVLVMAVLVMLMEPCCVRLDEKRKKKEQEKTQMENLEEHV